MAFVNWAASYPIVPGLGNLHERLAFNSSFSSMQQCLGRTLGTEITPPCQWTSSLVLLIYLFLSLPKVISGYKQYRSFHIFNVLLLAPTLGQMFHPHFTSLTPDIALFILGVLLSSRTYYFFINYDNVTYKKYYDVFYITILCTVGMTMKL